MTTPKKRHPAERARFAVSVASVAAVAGFTGGLLMKGAAPKPASATATAPGDDGAVRQTFAGDDGEPARQTFEGDNGETGDDGETSEDSPRFTAPAPATTPTSVIRATPYAPRSQARSFRPRTSSHGS